MATSKIWEIHSNLPHVVDYAASSVKTTVNYVTASGKTASKRFVAGLNCDPDRAPEQFGLVKRRFRKTGDILAYHAYLSFKEEDLDPDTAMAAAVEFAEKVWGGRFQVVIGLHLNTGHPHAHFVFNSVSFVDGKKAHDETTWWRVYPEADKICRKYGLHVISEPKPGKSGKLYLEHKTPGKYNRYDLLKDHIESAIYRSHDLMSFTEILRNEGCEIDFSPRHKYWTITPAGYNKPIRLTERSLGREYTKERLLERIQGHIVEEKAVKAFESPSVVNLPPASSFAAIWASYGFLMGLRQTKEGKWYAIKISTAALSPKVRPEVKKALEVCDRLNLISKENLTSIGQINDFLNRIDLQLAQVNEQIKIAAGDPQSLAMLKGQKKELLKQRKIGQNLLPPEKSLAEQKKYEQTVRAEKNRTKER